MSKNSINEISKIFCNSVKEIIETNTGSTINFSTTALKISTTFLKPDIGCFMQFYGDFSGLVIINFSGEAALEIYQKYMLNIGMNKESLTDNFNSPEVTDSLGEIINQIGGSVRREIEKKFKLSVKNNQPKAISISNSILISISSDLTKPQCRRISFKTEGQKSFHVEIAMENTQFIPLFEVDDDEEEFDINNLDIDTLIAENKQF